MTQHLIKKTWSKLGLPKQTAQYFREFTHHIYVVTDVGFLRLSINNGRLRVRQDPFVNPNRNHFYHEIDVGFLPPKDWIAIAGDTEWINNSANGLLRTLITGTTPFTIGDPCSMACSIVVYARDFVWIFSEAEMVMRFASYEPSAFQEHDYKLIVKKRIIPESVATHFDGSPYQLRVYGFDYAVYQPNTRTFYHHKAHKGSSIHRLPLNCTLIDFTVQSIFMLIVYMDDADNIYVVRFASILGSYKPVHEQCKLDYKLDLDSNTRCYIGSDCVVFINDSGITVVNDIDYTAGIPF